MVKYVCARLLLVLMVVPVILATFGAIVMDACDDLMHWAEDVISEHDRVALLEESERRW